MPLPIEDLALLVYSSACCFAVPLFLASGVAFIARSFARWALSKWS